VIIVLHRFSEAIEIHWLHFNPPSSCHVNALVAATGDGGRAAE